MKTLIVTVVMAVNAIAGVIAANVDSKFAYNTIVNEHRQVTSKIVYKVEAGGYLNEHLKYNFAYDNQNRVVRKEALRWDKAKKSYAPYYCLDCTYTEAGAEVTCSHWNRKSKSYVQVEKVTYQKHDDVVDYLSSK